MATPLASHCLVVCPKLRNSKKNKPVHLNRLIFCLIYKLPRRACSRSIDSNKALKLPFPNDLAPLR